MKTKTFNKTVSLLVSISSIPAFALNVGTVSGATVVQYSGKGGLCVLPIHSELEKIKKGDLKDEVKLCAMNFSSASQVEAPTGNAEMDLALKVAAGQPGSGVIMGLEPKLNSTNPGVLVMDPVETDSTEAKFKQSITCSYAPAALASYHISRILGGIGRTPVAVVRTMDKSMHSGIVKEALKTLASDPSQTIYKTWSQFSKKHETGSDRKIFDDSGAWVYGALSKNVKKEYKYTVISGVGSYDTRYQRFMQQPPFQRVVSSKGVLDIADAMDAGKVNVLKLAPALIQMKDVSDMVLLDTLLNQDDRIGNVHVKLKWYKLLADGSISEEDAKDQLKSVDAELAKISSKRHPGNSSEAELASISQKLNPFAAEGSQALLVREMVLKDNDCGGDVDIRTNQMRANSVLEAVAHMSPETYEKFMKLAEYAESSNPDAAKKFFRETFLYRDSDIGAVGAKGKALLANIAKAKSILKTNCESGKLKLDLDSDYLKKIETERNEDLLLNKAPKC